MPLVGLAIFAWIVHRTGAERIGAILADIDLPMLVWAPFLMAAIALSRGLRWRYVMRCVGIDLGLGRSTAFWMIGFFASAVTPAKAGDAIRAVYVRNETGRTMGEALLTVFLDRLWDLGFILAAGVVSAILFTRRYTDIPSAPLLVAGVVVVALLATLVTRKRLVRAALRPLFSLLVPAGRRDGLAANFHTFYEAMRVFGEDRRRAGVLAVLTLLGWGLIFLLAVYVARLVRIPVDPAYILLIMPIVTLVELLPFSIGGLGTRDATVIFFFAAVNVGSAEAVGFSLTYLLIGTYLTALAGLTLWLRSPIRWQRAGDGAAGSA